jgi:hypothetical protein
MSQCWVETCSPCICQSRYNSPCICKSKYTSPCICKSRYTSPCICQSKYTSSCICQSRYTSPCICKSRYTSPCFYSSDPTSGRTKYMRRNAWNKIHFNFMFCRPCILRKLVDSKPTSCTNILKYIYLSITLYMFRELCAHHQERSNCTNTTSVLVILWKIISFK